MHQEYKNYNELEKETLLNFDTTEHNLLTQI